MEEINNDELAKFHKQKRKKKRMILVVITTVFIAVSLISMIKYYHLNKKSSIKFTEDSNIEYKINLVEGQDLYEEDYVGENVNVVSELIDDMVIEFKYNLNIAEKIDYMYTYQIVADIQLKEKSKTNVIYSHNQEVFKSDQLLGNNNRLEIVRIFQLDYDYYNEKIYSIIEKNDLNNTESEISVSMILNVIDKNTGERINQQANVMRITMPLNTKTVEVLVNENVKNTEGKIIIPGEEETDSKKYLIVSLVTLGIGAISLICLLRYIAKTRSAEKMYEKELNKIIFDYKSYVQKIAEPLDYKAYKIVKIGSFMELLQMKEEVQSPILMYTEKEQMKTIFSMIKDDILFTYILSSTSIRKKLIEESKKRK